MVIVVFLVQWINKNPRILMGKKVFKSSQESIMMGREIDDEKFQDCYLMHMYTYINFAKRIASHNPWHF